MKLTRIIFAAAACSLTLSAVSCTGKNKNEPEPVPENIGVTEPEQPDMISGQTLVWLGDYDLNPENGEERSNALAIFEDHYGGKIKYVRTSRENKFNDLDNMINSGDEVDIFPYEDDVFPGSVMSGRFQHLDPYFDILGMDEDIWQDMTGVIESFACGGEHYVIPYSISQPEVITYSRKMIKEEGLDDPCKLYEQGKWDWDAMMSMMETFVAAAEEGKPRFGIAGEFGQALINSTGHGVIEWDGSKPVSRLDSDDLAKAENLMHDIAAKKLYRNEMLMNYPADNSTLFFAMGDWSLGDSNAQNPDSDLMIVPFPKSPGAKENYITCRFSARMLVKNSTKGEAAAAYMKCERIAATEETYIAAARENALAATLRAPGMLKYFMTGEQYDAIRSYVDPNSVVPVIDCGYGMGRRMSGGTGLTFEQKGVMEKLDNALLEGDVADWETLRELCKPVVDEEISSLVK